MSLDPVDAVIGIEEGHEGIVTIRGYRHLKRVCLDRSTLALSVNLTQFAYYTIHMHTKVCPALILSSDVIAYMLLLLTYILLFHDKWFLKIEKEASKGFFASQIWASYKILEFFI